MSVFDFRDYPEDMGLINEPRPLEVAAKCERGQNVDAKTISKWARALRYVARSKEPAIGLRMFMKEAGGVNACACRYAKRVGRGHRW